MKIIIRQKFSLILALLILNLLYGYGQEILSREQEREIKTSGKFYFGECTSFDEVEAKSCALNELTQAVIVSMMQQALAEKKDDLLSNLDVQANTARLQMTGRIKILAWIEKDKIYGQNAEPQPTPQPEPQPTPQPPQPVPQPTPQPENQPTPQPVPQPVPQPTPQSVSDNSSRPTISNPIVQDLAGSGTSAQFQRNAENWKRQGKLIYGSRKTAFLSPDKCFIAVFSSGTLIALLGEGNNSRVDLLTGQTVQNPEQHYSGNQLIWIQIN